MADTDPLAGLKPLVAPPPVSWWPPAPGWWLLAGTLLLLLVTAGVWIWKRHRFLQRTRYRREALTLLDSAHDVQAIAQLIRRAALSCHPREQVASAPWETLCPQLTTPSLLLLREAQYRADSPPAADLDVLRRETCQWLNTLPPVPPQKRGNR